MEAPHDDDDRFFPMINLQQQYLEEYLTDAVLAHPLIELRWGNRVTGRGPQRGWPTATLRSTRPKGPTRWNPTGWWPPTARAPASAQMMDLKLEGASYEGRFVIADIRIDLPLPTERLAFFDPDWNPGNTILMHREPHGIWRVDYQLPAGETPEQALRPRVAQGAHRRAAGHDRPWRHALGDGLVLGLFGPRPDAARLRARPRAVHRRRGAPAADLRRARRQHRLAGRAEPGLAPGLRGAGRGARVAAAELQQRARGRGREIIDEAGKSTRFMTPPTRGFRLLRDAVLSLSLSQAFVRPALPLAHLTAARVHPFPAEQRGRRQRPVQGRPGHGAPPQNIRLGADDYLLDHLGGGFDLLYFTEARRFPRRCGRSWPPQGQGACRCAWSPWALPSRWPAPT
jgi:3-(3-hydroxy-phenyl)propionate hydroxylase